MVLFGITPPMLSSRAKIRIAGNSILWHNANLRYDTGDWRSGSAGALQAQGQRFKSVIAHQKHKRPENSGLFFIAGR